MSRRVTSAGSGRVRLYAQIPAPASNSAAAPPAIHGPAGRCAAGRFLATDMTDVFLPGARPRPFGIAASVVPVEAGAGNTPSARILQDRSLKAEGAPQRC